MGNGCRGCKVNTVEFLGIKGFKVLEIEVWSAIGKFRILSMVSHAKLARNFPDVQGHH
jgi:hypothetical protein